MPWQHAVGEPRGADIAVALGRHHEGRFGVMFKDLGHFEPPDALLVALAATMVDSGAPDQDNPAIPSGFTFLGQLIDHDMARDNTPLTEQQQDPHAVVNFRTARFDLDSVYGDGPSASPDLYDPADPAKLRVTGLGVPNGVPDMPRRPDGSAFIGDSRDDENLIVSQLHVAFLRFHNRLVDHVRSQGAAANLVFDQARRLTQWYYQWVIVHDFLARFVGQALVDQLLEESDRRPPKVKLKYYKPRNPRRPFMPVEYAVAAYRFAHSIVRPGYLMSDTAGGPLFSDPPSANDLHGGRPVPPQFKMAFHNFFDIPGVPGPPKNLTRTIDSRLSSPLFHLPVPGIVPAVPAPPIVSLAERNLLRGKKLGLPAGQDVARRMGYPSLDNAQLGLTDPGWGGKAPLWFYVLKEAELQHGGLHLGDAGGRIVAEVILGILAADFNSYFYAHRIFKPQPPIAPAPGQFKIGDLLRFAGSA